MPDFEQFPHAPIVEALLDIRVTSPASVDLDQLATFGNTLGKTYPFRETRAQWTGQVEIKLGGPPVTQGDSQVSGYLFRSADGKQVVQARKDGFSFSRLRPYQDWASLSREARALWTQYTKLVKPGKVTRIALRYINRIELPLPLPDFKEYILTGPELAPSLPQSLGTFFFRVVVPDDTTGLMTAITETIDESSTTKETLPLIFDIDVFRQGTFPIAAEKLWPLFDALRLRKNQVFHGSITEKTRELFR